MNETGISWTGLTWNPVSGCSKVSPGCAYCYACTRAERLRGHAAFPNGFDLQLRPHKLTEPDRLEKPSLIFVNSMSDAFHEKIPDAYRHQVFDTMERNPRHKFQVLTKRPENMVRFSRERKFPQNVWAGVSIELQKYVERADLLRQVDATVRFISAEPLLGPLKLDLTGIHWLIVGGESGPHLNDLKVADKRALVVKEGGKWVPRKDRAPWVYDLQQQAKSAGTAFFFKQWGGPKSTSGGAEL